MKTIIGLVFCLLLGVSIRGQGWTALLWVPVGFGFGLFSTAQIALPVILGIPRAIRLVRSGQMRRAVFGAIVLTPVIWVVSLAIVTLVVGWFWPKAVQYLYSNAALNLSANLGTLAVLLSPLSKSSRADFRQDFDKAYQRFCITVETDHKDAEIKEMQGEIDRLHHDLDLLEDTETIYSFGQMAFDGDGVEQDYAQAANWYRIAAEKGHARAQHNLALMYENGQGLTRDLAAAAKWYRMAADQGNAGSQNNLATLYENGEGVPQDDTVALDLYRQAAKGGDENAASNVRRLESLLKGRVGDRKRYEKMVFAFSDLMAAHSPLIGDSSLLPYPKGTLLYAIRWVMDEYETNREDTGNEELRLAYDKILPTLSYLFTRLARDWHEIDPADKDAIAKLRDCESFPEWALQYKRKYIDDERASNEAAQVAFQVMKDRVAQEKSEA